MSMTGIERRVSQLEKRTGVSEPIAINIRKTIMGENGEVARVDEEVVTISGNGRSKK